MAASRPWPEQKAVALTVAVVGLHYMTVASIAFIVASRAGEGRTWLMFPGVVASAALLGTGAAQRLVRFMLTGEIQKVDRERWFHRLRENESQRVEPTDLSGERDAVGAASYAPLTPDQWTVLTRLRRLSAAAHIQDGWVREGVIGRRGPLEHLVTMAYAERYVTLGPRMSKHRWYRPTETNGLDPRQHHDQGSSVR